MISTFDLKTTITESTITHTTTDPWGRIVEEVMDTKEKATREALLFMGWLPPEETEELLHLVNMVTSPYRSLDYAHYVLDTVDVNWHWGDYKWSDDFIKLSELYLKIEDRLDHLE